MNTPLEVCCGGIGSAVAGFITNPLDIMRTRMQVQGDLCKSGEFAKHYHNIPQGLLRVAREEGVFALQKGLLASMQWQFIQNGLRIGLYPFFQNGWEEVYQKGASLLHPVGGSRGLGGAKQQQQQPPDEQRRGGGRPNMLVSLAAGACSGAIGSFCASPFILVKTRLQSQRGRGRMEEYTRQASGATHPSSTSTSRRSGVGRGSVGRGLEYSTPMSSSSSASAAAALKKSTGTQHGYHGVRDAFSSIYASGGIRALWYGSRTAMKRTMVGSSVQLVSYDYASRHILQYGEARSRARGGGGGGGENGGLSSSSWSAKDPRIHCTAALLSSFVVVLFMNPFEVVMTRTYNHTIGNADYSGTIRSALRNVYRTEGVRGLYKGCGPMLARFAPHTVVSFVVYEWLRAHVGLSPSTSQDPQNEKYSVQ